MPTITPLAITAVIMVFLAGCTTTPKHAVETGEVVTTQVEPIESQAQAPPAESQPIEDRAEVESVQPTLVVETQETAPDTAEPQQPLQPRPSIVTPFPHITVDLDQKLVIVESIACLDVGWLEQVLCGEGSREHESLVVTKATPSQIHAALLMAGFTPGKPGEWSYDNQKVTVTKPQGDQLEVLARYQDEDGTTIIEPLRSWIRDHHGEKQFPQDAWIFGGSYMRPAPRAMNIEGDVYVADYSGSIIGIVTFGDEVVGFPEVLPDQVDVHAAEWEVHTERVPPLGTQVDVILASPDTAAALLRDASLK
ncbi:MAG: YdjY domain-containing protein [Phycisphaerales bacterium]